MEGHVFPPFKPLAPHPDDPAYRECDRSRPAEKAREKSEAHAAAIREFYDAALPKPGYHDSV
jgi:hypothetical protein